MENVIANVIVVVILLAIVGGIAFYLYRAKKRGEACIGCPYAKQCSGKCGGSCGSGKNSTEADA